MRTNAQTQQGEPGPSIHQSVNSEDVLRRLAEQPFPDAKGRVEVHAPTEALTLLEPTKIRVTVHMPGIASLRVREEGSPERGQAGVVEGSEQELTIVEDGNEDKSVVIVPRHIGQSTFVFVGDYADHGFVQESIIANVLPPKKAPESIVLFDSTAPHRDAKVIHVPFIDNGSAIWLGLRAKFPGVDEAIEIPPSLVTYRIKDKASTPLLRIDQNTGHVWTMYKGHVLVEASFGGLTYRSCLIVEDEAELWQDSSECQELRNTREALGQTRQSN